MKDINMKIQNLKNENISDIQESFNSLNASVNSTLQTEALNQIHIQIVKPLKHIPKRTTGLACIPSGGPPDSAN